MGQPLEISRFRRFAKEACSIGLLLLGLLAVRSTLADHYYVPSGSMQPNLMPGDRVVVDKRAYGLRVPFTQLHLLEGAPVQRGEVVIFDSPRDGTRLIKRIVAIGGDEVAIRNGHLLVNGKPMATASRTDVEVFAGRIVRLDLSSGGGPDYSDVIPAGMLLAVGDHRGNSLDGRIFGVIEEGSVYGRAIAVYYRRDNGSDLERAIALRRLTRRSGFARPVRGLLRKFCRRPLCRSWRFR